MSTPSSRKRTQLARTAAAALLVAPLSACGFSHINRDTSERPEVTTGSAARVIMPGEPMPSMEDETPVGEPVMIGGAEAEGDASRRSRDVPLGPITALFGYPFWIFGKTVAQKADKAVQEREAERRADPANAARNETAQDRAQAERLERENQAMREQLRERSVAVPPLPIPVPAPAPQPSAAAGSSGDGGQALRDELAALERALGQRGASVAPSSAPALASAPSAPSSSNAEDRDGDGRPDRWTSGDPAQPTRELLDENGDGRADRVRVYDAERRLQATEDDLDFDGKFELLTDYKDGERVRTREDTNGDGEIDGWSFFRTGELVRREADRDGDGLRDLVAMYKGGQLQRQEEDRNADGQPDRIELFEAGEVAERHEDVDFDGTPDVASYFKNGKLVRKELSSPQVLERWNRKEEK